MKTPACAWSADPALHISASAWPLACHVLATVLAALSLCLSALPPLWCVAGLLLMLTVSWCGYRSLKNTPDMRFQVSAGNVLLLQDDASQPPVRVRLRRSWHLSHWLLQIQYRFPDSRRWHSLLVWPDSASAETRRILRSHEAFDFSPTVPRPSERSG